MDLLSHIRTLNEGCDQLQKNVQELSKVQSRLNVLNACFQSVTDTLQVFGACLHCQGDENEPPLGSDAEGCTARDDDSQATRQETPSQQKRQVKRKTAAKRPANGESSQWNWPKGMREKIPKKFDNRQDIRRLEIILLFCQAAKSKGAALADLVRHSGLSAMRCNELLNALIRLGAIVRKKDRTGFRYMLAK